MSAGTATIKKQIAGTYGDDQTETDTDDYFNVVQFTADKHVVDGAAGDVYTIMSIKAPFDLEVKSLTICPGAALTANDTNFATFTLAKADGAGGFATTIAAISTTTTGTGNWVADVFEEVAITVPSAVRVNKGQILTLKKTVGAAGVAVPNAHYNLKVQKV